jgi:hypothetical protein
VEHTAIEKMCYLIKRLFDLFAMSESIQVDYILPYRSLSSKFASVMLEALTVSPGNTGLHCDVDLHSSRINGVLPPVAATDLATKFYSENTFVWIDTYLTAKGDLLTHSAIEMDALPVGLDDTMLVAAPAAPMGMSWTNYLSTRGSLITRTLAGNSFCGMTQGSILRTEPADPNGISPFAIWTVPSAYGSLLTVDNVPQHTILPRGTDDYILASSSVSPGLAWVPRTVRTSHTTDVLGATAPNTMSLEVDRTGNLITLYVDNIAGFLPNNSILTMPTFFAADQLPASNMVFSFPMDETGTYYMASLWCTAGSQQAILSKGADNASIFPISGIVNYYGSWIVQYISV